MLTCHICVICVNRQGVYTFPYYTLHATRVLHITYHTFPHTFPYYTLPAPHTPPHYTLLICTLRIQDGTGGDLIQQFEPRQAPGAFSVRARSDRIVPAHVRLHHIMKVKIKLQKKSQALSV